MDNNNNNLNNNQPINNLNEVNNGVETLNVEPVNNAPINYNDGFNNNVMPSNDGLQNNNTGFNTPEPKKPGNGKLIAIIIIVLVLVAAGLSYVFIFSDNGILNDNNPSTNGDINNDGNNDSNNGASGGSNELPPAGELTMADLENAPVTDESMFRGRARNGEYILTGCSSDDEIIVVPETIEGYPVAIIDSAFYETSARGIKLPDTVHTLKMGAFSMTDTLEIVSLGNGIVTVEEMAFHTASLLKSLTFPEGTITLEDQSINDCEGLKEVFIPDSINDLDQYGEPFAFCENVTVKGSANSLAKEIADASGLPYEEIK